MKKSLLDILQQVFQNDYIASISIIFLLILLFIIGIAVFFTTIYWRKQSTEYYNALNKFRKFFKTKKFDIQDYIVLPTREKSALEKGVDFVTSLIIGIVNIVIVSLLIIVLYFVFFPTWWLIFIGTISLIACSIYLIYKYRRILK